MGQSRHGNFVSVCHVGVSVAFRGVRDVSTRKPSYVSFGLGGRAVATTFVERDSGGSMAGRRVVGGR